MRRDGTIREQRGQFATVFCAVLLALSNPTPWSASRASADEVGTRGTAAVDSTMPWLPAPVEEIESPERLAEPPLRGVAAIRCNVSGGRATSARFVGTARARSLAVTAARIETRADGARQTILVSGFGERLRLGAGRVVVRDASVLLGEAVGLSRRLRRPLDPRPSAPAWESPQGATSPGVAGATLAIGSARGPNGGVAARSLWAIGGRGADDGMPLFAAGVGLRAQRWAAAVSVARRFRSVAARWRGRTSAVALEALLSREHGPSLLAAVTSEAAGSPVRFGARWRRRAGERRPVAAELTTEVVAGRAGVARLTWRPWSAGGSAFADDGAVELDARWRTPLAPGVARARVGRRGGEGTVAASVLNGGLGGAAALPERYVVIDLPLREDGGRLLSLLASRRERGTAEAIAIGTTVGARARLAWRGRGGVTAQVEAARTRGSRASGGVAAWSSALSPSGEETLTARGSGGVYVTASGWVRVGPVAVRAHARDGESERGGRPLVATVWVEWSGSANRNSAAGDAGSGG